MDNRASMAKSAVAMSIISVITLSISFFKESVFAFYFGASATTDAYTIAIQIPVIIFSLVSTAIGNVVLPYYMRELTEKGNRKASLYISNVMTLIATLSIFIIIILEVFSNEVILIFAPGLNDTYAQLASHIFRLILPTIILTELININTAVMNVHKSFLLPSIGSMVLNLIFVSVIILTAEIYGINAAVIGTILGSIISFLYSILIRRKYFKYSFICNPKDPSLISSMKKTIPIFVGIGAAEVNKLVDTLVASFLNTGAISMLSYASKLSSAVSTLLVNSITTVVYQEFAESAAKKDDKRMAASLLFSIKMILFVMIPIMAGGALLSKEIITIVYRRGAFDSYAVDGTAPIFSMYLLCLLFIALRQVASRVFYAYGDTIVPMKNSLFGIALNIILDFSVVKFLGAIGLALATTFANALISILILIELKKKNNYISYNEVLPLFARISLASFLMVGSIYCIRIFILDNQMLSLNGFIETLLFTSINVVLGVVVYCITLFLLKTEELSMIIGTILRRKK